MAIPLSIYGPGAGCQPFVKAKARQFQSSTSTTYEYEEFRSLQNAPPFLQYVRNRHVSPTASNEVQFYK